MCSATSYPVAQRPAYNPLSRKRRVQVEERGGIIVYGMEAFLFGTSELLLGVNDLVDAFANSAGE